jgi:uncharacterized protein (DUF58 family)
MLEKLERLALRWRRSFAGPFGGHNPSRHSGAGLEFQDHRHFHHGDDIRGVDWHAYMRLERLFLKMFQIEPRAAVRVLVDTSESMACGDLDGHGEPKFSYACRLAAMLCYVGLVKLDTMVLQPFSTKLGPSHKAQGGRHRFALALRFLMDLETGGHSDFSQMARELISTHTARGLVVVISDFLDSATGCEIPLQHLADYGYELLLVHVGGPEDRLPPWRGELELIDAESGEMRRLRLDDAAARDHASAYDRFCRGLQYIALRNNGHYVQLTTDTPVEEAVFGPLVHASGMGFW